MKETKVSISVRIPVSLTVQVKLDQNGGDEHEIDRVELGSFQSISAAMVTECMDEDDLDEMDRLMRLNPEVKAELERLEKVFLKLE